MALVAVAVVALAAAALAWSGAPADLAGAAARSDVPTPAAGAPSRLRAAVAAPAAGGAYAFSLVQEDGTTPVAYDPCRPIAVVVNEAGAPAGSGRMVADALARIGDATGLLFRIEGTTDERPTVADRDAYQPERYGDRWAPVLVAWSDEVAHPPLAGTVAGTGGSTAMQTDDAGWVYVTGSVVLDAPQLGQIGRGRGGYREVEAVLVHELAHVVGLAHVDDHSQLMHPTNGAVSELAGGDLAGLAALGRGACAERL